MPKIVPSGYRILYVMLLLLSGKFSQKEINQKMSANPCIEQAFAKDTLLKIINTLKASDIKISKIESRYYIFDLPWKIEQLTKFKDVLQDLGVFTASLGQEELLKNYREFLSSLSGYLPEDFFGKDFGDFYCGANLTKYKKYLQLIRKIEAAKKNNSRIKLITMENGFVFDSYGLEYDSSNVFLSGYSVKEHEIKKINLSEIKSLRQLPQKASGMFFPSCVTFRLKGRLAKSYNIRENEKIIAWEGDDIVVANKGDDKKLLLKRLFRYKNLCEIIAPEAFREEFVTMAQETLSLYESL